MNTAIFIELTDYSSREKLTVDGNLRLFNQLLKSIQEPHLIEAITPTAENDNQASTGEQPTN